MPGMLGMQDASGSGQRVERKLWPAQSRNTAVPPFWVYDASTSAGTPPVVTFKVKITGGYMLYPFTDLVVDVADSTTITVQDADYIWLQRDGNSTWTFGHGATAPADKMTINLANIIIAGSPEVMTIDRTWDGGDYPLPTGWPVVLNQIGGVQGGGEGGADCTWTYSITANDSTILYPGGVSPVNSDSRIDGVGYFGATSGWAYFENDGSVSFFALDEYAIVKTQTIVTGVTYDTSTHELAITTQDLVVFDTGTEDEDATVDTADTCP